jgi:hypothetical protein
VNSHASNGQCYCDTGYGVYNDKCLLASTINLIQQMHAQIQALLVQCQTAPKS